ncbi:MAG: glycosyltransferase family 2 protein, partial [Burkholderiales bacterium]|nr:glycosyltransferase family 2 protein [Burkholderiales bacterium]
MSISVIVIAKNEAHAITKCLESVSWADEIVVVDSGSTDGTVEICEEHGAKVTVTDWPGFGPQKNRALDLAGCDWILSLDA